MITLICGLPGHGKSLFTVSRIAAEAEKDGKNVYFSGIPECNVPGWKPLTRVEDWPKLPPGSVVVVDEAHTVFPQRPAGSVVPPHVQAMAVHRGMGIDVVLITQDGNSVDHFIRRRVGRYLHVFRPYGAARATVWEFPAFCDWKDRRERLAAKSSHFAFPASAYRLYKSAEIHTVKRSVPWKFALLPLSLAGIAFCGWYLYGLIFAEDAEWKSRAKKMVEPASRVASGQIVGLAGGGKAVSAQAYLLERIPRLADMPESAPVFDTLAKPVDFPRVAGCVQKPNSCVCYSQQGTRLPSVSASYCATFVRAGAFDPYRKGYGAAPHAEQQPSGIGQQQPAAGPSGYPEPSSLQSRFSGVQGVESGAARRAAR